MKKLFTTLFLLTTLFTTTAFSQTSDGSRVLTGSAQPPLPFNMLPQPGFENRTTGWSVTSGTFTTTEATANVARGRFSASWIVPTSTSSGILLQSDAITIPAGLMGRQCVAAILSKGNALTNGSMVLEAYDGTTTYGTKALSDSTNYVKTFSAVFTCPTSGTLRLRIRTTSSSPASPTAVYFDEAYLGDNDSFGNGGLLDVTPTVSVANNDTLSVGAASRQLIYVQSTGGAVTLNATTAFTNGGTNGQELIIAGRSDTDTVAIPTTGNVVLKSSSNKVLGLNDLIYFEWDAVNSKWVEVNKNEYNFSDLLGVVTVPQGGTGISSGNSGGIPYFSSSTTIASSPALTANQLLIGGGAGVSPSALGSLGTSSTLLHGNASGAPTFGAVALGSEVSGTLPIANGGTNNGSLSVTGGATYYGDGSKIVALAPGSSGQVFTSGGTGAPTWTSALTNPMTTQGDIIYGGASGAATRLAAGTFGQFLVSAPSGGAPSYRWSGTSTVSSAGFTLTTTDGITQVFWTTGASNRTGNLPAASGSGRIISFTKSDSGAGFATLDGNSTDTINGQLTYGLYYQYDSVTLIDAASGAWLVVDEKNFASGTYTPTLTAGTNVASATGAPSRWFRQGNYVTVYGEGSVDPTTAGTTTEFTVTLPIAPDANFSGDNADTGGGTVGMLASSGTNGGGGAIFPVSGAQTMTASFAPVGNANRRTYFTFYYKLR